MKTEISYEELVRTYARLYDAGNMIEQLRTFIVAGSSERYYVDLEAKLNEAKDPLYGHIRKIETENPGRFE